MKPNQPDKLPKKSQALLGLGLDGDDGHTHITRGKDLLLVGGSEDTHGRMQETAIKLCERLKKRGKSIRNASIEEFREIIHELIHK